MAKTVEYYDLPTPTNLSGSLVAGGTLVANTTYYYRVISIMSGASTFNICGGKSLKMRL